MIIDILANMKLYKVFNEKIYKGLTFLIDEQKQIKKVVIKVSL